MPIFGKTVNTLQAQVSPAPQKPPKIQLTKIFIPLNIKNKNGRIYTRENLEEHVQDFLYRKSSLGEIYGELNHPDSLDTNLSRISHIIDSIWFDNNKLMGKITILNTNWGKVAQELIKDGIPLEVRPRSSGTVDSNGYVHLKKLFTFDLIEQQKDAFFGNQEIRKLKLNKLAKYFEEQGILKESYDSSYDEPELPILSEDFHILKKQFNFND